MSSAQLSSITTGHVITMFSSDAQKIQEVNYATFDFLFNLKEMNPLAYAP